MKERLRFESELSDLGVGESEARNGQRAAAGRIYRRSEFDAEVEREAPQWAASIDPFPVAPIISFDLSDERMKTAFAGVASDKTLRVCTALVDLTDPARPVYAGVYDDEMIFAGSLPKIAAMYAAFTLRSRVQAFVNAAHAAGVSVQAPSMIAEIDKTWRPHLSGLYPDRPMTSIGNKQDMFPALGQIFDFAASGRVDFARASPFPTDKEIDRSGGAVLPRYKFHEWMRSMIRWSNNTAASKCIMALGYPYLNGALARAGLFDATTTKGLWLSADYRGHDWVKTDAERKANAAGKPLAPWWATAQRRKLSNVTATASQVARFMALLALDKLVVDEKLLGKTVRTPGSNEEMQALMKADAGGLGSDFHDALRRAEPPPSSVLAKFGRGDDGFRHECAIIKRRVDSKDLKYVAVGLGYPAGRPLRKWFDLVVSLDKVIVTRNK